MIPEYQVYAFRYATMSGRMSHHNAISTDAHASGADLDFFVWLIRGEGRDILVDTGFNQGAAATRNRNLSINPIDALSNFGIDVAAIRDVVITHLHYDHAGNLDRIPNARFHVQEREMAYATGRCMCHEYLRHPFSVDDVTQMVRHVYCDRVSFHCGDGEVAPGITLHHIGGHSDGLQVVRVNTRRGPIVLASDAAHYYENMILKRPFPIVYNVGAMMEGWRKLEALAGHPDRIIPGHDPLVSVLYPPSEVALSVFQLHREPSRPPNGPKLAGNNDQVPSL